MFLDDLLGGFVLNLEGASKASTVALISSLLFLIVVAVDKKIKFRKVMGVERMMRMKNFSTSDMHYRMSVFLPLFFIYNIYNLFNILSTERNVSMCRRLIVKPSVPR